ncbi:MAG: hypothetical protein WBA29_13110, partial [Xanthobacteraceae bacterium]
MVAVLAAATVSRAAAASDIAACADERVKTAMLPAPELAAAEAACGRVLAGGAAGMDRQKAAFFRGLMRFLQVVQGGMAQGVDKDGVPRYAPPTLAQLREALADVETAAGLDGPIKGDALALRVTISQVLGDSATAKKDIDKAIAVSPRSATPYV